MKIFEDILYVYIYKIYNLKIYWRKDNVGPNSTRGHMKWSSPSTCVGRLFMIEVLGFMIAARKQPVAIEHNVAISPYKRFETEETRKFFSRIPGIVWPAFTEKDKLNQK